MDVPSDVVQYFRGALISQIGELPPGSINDDELHWLAVDSLSSRFTPPLRERWLSAFPVGSFVWPKAYTDCCARRSGLPDHEVLLELLFSKVSRLCWLSQKAYRKNYADITPYAVFRADGPGAHEARCKELHGCAWHIDDSMCAFKQALECPNPECGCMPMVCDGRTLTWLKQQGANVRINAPLSKPA